MVQGAAFSINFKWASDGAVRHSVMCTAQGAISQVGDLGAALWFVPHLRASRPYLPFAVRSLAIAYHTFSLLFLLKKPSIWTTRIILGAGWTVIIVLPIVGPHVIQNVEKSGYFFGLIGPWCWIGSAYRLEWYIYLYIWILLSLASSILMYGLIYLRLSGRLSIENGKLVWKTSGQSWGLNCIAPSWAARDNSSSFPASESGSSGGRAPVDPDRVSKHLKKIARRLMLYPLGK
ncbi:hypothetical protein FRC10_008395 [Ceratobasidium sp. 414]|nr:hypothetical protein FRC10_008395 [Ceratobasidium sp. 414]